MAAADATTGKTGWRAGVWGEHLSEFLGVMVLIMLGDGVVAMAVAALNQSGRGPAIFVASGDWLIIVFGWFWAVVAGVYVAGGITGAHINPAVTVSFALRRGFPWPKVPGYIAAQVLGAFTGAAIVYAVYKGAIDSFEGVHHVVRGQASSVGTYSIFATFPAPYLHNWVGPFVDQVVGTALLVGLVFAVSDELNLPVRANLTPYIVGMIVGAIGISYGANAGYAINPARDFGPRMFALIAGWGKIAMPGDYGNVNTYFWIPIVGPFVGGAIGAYIYDIFINKTLVALGKRASPTLEEMGVTVEDLSGFLTERGGPEQRGQGGPEQRGSIVEEP
jgi:glycerol uptake facilitator protein